MTLASEQVIQVQSPDIAALLREHVLDPSITHTNLEVEHCACFEVQVVAAFTPAFEGRICANCGGSQFITTGTCHTCQTCATSDGCG